MTDPICERQLEELNMVKLCTRILIASRDELYLNMHFLDISLSSLGYKADSARKTISTDGFVIYYNPDYLCRQYRRGRVYVNRAYLHMVFHCLFSHMDTIGERARDYWNLACDIAMESIVDGLYQKCVHVSPSPFRREIYLRLGKKMRVLTAEGIYQALQEMELSETRYIRLADDFKVDDHDLWYEDKTRSQTIPRQNRWNDNREKMQTQMEAMSQEENQSDDERNLLEQVKIENREHYGNMPLIEPLESKEIVRIEDFVIVVDTSMSCSGDLVRRFLEETYSVLAESESYFKKINIHIIQCDDQVRSDARITSRQQMEEYMKDFTIAGMGGTDFRPAFEYVNQLRQQGEFAKLKGLLYFTDGKGIYPVKMPSYDVAFVFIKDQYQDESVPAWAMKLILDADDLKL